MTLQDGLYNRATGLPSAEAFTPYLGSKFPYYTRHAAAAAQHDFRFTAPLPLAIYVHQNEVVEMEVRGGKVSRLVVRQHYSENEDVVFVLSSPHRDAVTVVTVWLNAAHDKHYQRRDAVQGRRGKYIQQQQQQAA